MKTMIELFSREETGRLERRKTAGVCLAAAAAVLGLAVCVAICRMTTTANAARMEPLLIGAGVLGGWLAIGFWTLVAVDAKREAGHAEMILSGERAAVPGTVRVARERLRIRNSISIRKVTVGDGKTTRTLNVDERKAKALGAAGENITLYAVNGYVAAYETDDPPARPVRTPLHARLWRKFLSQLPLYALWLVFGAMLWSWVFTFVTDTRPEKKVTVFVDAYAVEDTALAVALERALPEGIRMVKVHPVSYVMFDDEALRGADIFILRASDAPRYEELLAQLPEPSVDGTGVLARGKKLYDAATGQGSARDYIQYNSPGQPAEDYYLFIGANSLHTGTLDEAALAVIAQLENLP